MRWKRPDASVSLPGAFLALAASLVGCDSGSSGELSAVSSSIIGGTPDTTHKGVVSLLKRVEGGFVPSCSGTLLTQNLVLTAHHCVAALSSGDAGSVECGKTEFRDTDLPRDVLISVEGNVWDQQVEPFTVAEVWVPPGSAAVCGRDVALLMLSGAGVPAHVATPITPRLGSRLQPDEVFAAVGYGLQDPRDQTGETSGQRMSSSNAKVFCEGSACGTRLVGEGEFIAESPVCSGDSGGPAIDEQGRVSGVTSRGDEECTIGIYASVASWRDFIVEKAFIAAQSGNYAPPAWAGKPPPGYVPAIDPLGTSCTGECSSAYVCWSESSSASGICVPPCSAADTSCPASFTCDTQLNACIQDSPAASEAASSSCATSTPAGGAGGFWLGLGLLTVQISRRARRR